MTFHVVAITTLLPERRGMSTSFIYGMFSDVSSSDYRASSGRMNNVLDRMSKEAVLWPNLKYYHSICLEGSRKTMKDINHDSQSLG